MGVIIGSGSTVTSPQFPNGGILSVSFGFNPQVQRLYELGSFSPYDSTVQKTRTIQINVYGKKASGAGGSATMDISPSTTCEDAGAVSITVTPASCLTSLLPFTGTYFLTGYSYQKDQLGYGQESWSFTSKPIISGYTGTIVMLRGIAEGTISTGAGVMAASEMGVVINEAASNDAYGANIEGESGSVSAGTPGLGNYDIQRYIIATTVGASTGSGALVDGYAGQANIQIPMTPVYV